MGELLAGILLTVGAVVFVLTPILRPRLADDPADTVASGNEGEDPADDLSPRAVALRALKEIEFDRATGKLGDGDYDALTARYTAEALAALRADAGPPEGPTRAPAVAGRAHDSVRAPACPTHGPRPESDAAFCSECGRRLAAAPGYCARCGAALECEARYCHSCGARVAA
jgi:hypothetical protein